MDLRSQHQPVGVHQDVALASGQTLRSVVTTLGAAHPGGLYDLAVDHRSARVPVASLRLAHLFAQPVMRSSEPAVDPPPAEKMVVHRLPGWVLSWEHAPRAAAPQSR
jgi:hypothetical protein